LNGIKIGYHVSISGALDHAPDRARETGCTTFQIFTSSPRQWRVTEIKEDTINEFRRKLRQYGFDEAAVHMPYLPNLSCPSSSEVYTKSVESLGLHAKRCSQLGIPYLVTHFGSHMGAGVENGHKQFARAVNKVLEDSSRDTDVTLLLENTAGSKNSVGSTFEHIKLVLDQIKLRNKVGVCLDSCHLFAAGYDIRDKKAVDETMKKFDEILGYENLKLVHLNDSRGDFSAGVDRHEHIGLGKIGKKGMKSFLSDDTIRGVPIVLETSVDDTRTEVEDLHEAKKLASL
jgi:deoxyribonuclease-4